MGGSGSGQWYRWDKKTTVEECRSLDAARWMREGILASAVRRAGAWLWIDSVTGKQTASIGYVVDTTTPPRCTVRLFYTVTPYGGKSEPIDYHILLARTTPYFGGERWWFICPLVVNGRPCYRRVGKLYLPPGGRYFGCRQCHDLTYMSCQESDKRVSALARDPKALYEAMARGIAGVGEDTLAGVPDLLLVLKARDKVEKRRLHQGAR